MTRLIDTLRASPPVVRYTPFYRHFPYRGDASLSSLDSRGCVDLPLNFFYNRVPKAANSSIVSSLASMKFGREIQSREAKKSFRRPSSLSAREVQAFDALFKFTFVRDPFSRTLSAYLDKVERRALREERESSFDDFLNELRDGALYSNAHWAPQSSILLIPLSAFDFVGRVETLDEDLGQVLGVLSGDQARPEIRSVLSNSTDATAKLAKYYTPSSRALVQVLYRDDFEMFDYDSELAI